MDGSIWSEAVIDIHSNWSITQILQISAKSDENGQKSQTDKDILFRAIWRDRMQLLLSRLVLRVSVKANIPSLSHNYSN
jgi:hypothetical protein